MIKAVFFDIDNTLYSFKKTHKIAMESLDNYAQDRLNVEPFVFRQTAAEVQGKIQDRLGENNSAIHSRIIRFQNVMAALGKPVHPYAREMSQLYWRTLILYAVPEPGISCLMRDLKEKGIYIGIGTDMTAYIQSLKLEKLGLAGFIDGIVTSEEAGVEKPDKILFDLCIAKAGCLPKECLFIGDHPVKDIKGARDAGMHALCYRRYSKPVEAEEEFCIDSYEDRAPFVRLGIF